MKKLPRPMAFTLIFILVNLIWRIIFLPVNQSSYTDGILQVDMFNQGLSYWPPLYALVSRLFAWIPILGLEGAGRLISLLAGILILFPLMALTRRLFGLRAAIWAMVAWTASPLALQWSLQVMTDMPLAFLWTCSLAALLIGVENYVPDLFPHEGPVPAPDARAGDQWLLLASLCGALATLTRYQGIFLLLPLVWTVWKLTPLAKILTGRPLRPWLMLAPWIAVPAWVAQGLGTFMKHFQQIGERAALGGGLETTLIQVYYYNFEEFLLKSPYFVTYGLFGFMLYGLFRTQWTTARLRWTGWVCLYLTLGILILQSIFSSYQFRYLLPLVPLVCIFAGHGLAVWERKQEGHPLRLWGLIFPAILFGLVFSALVASLQGNPFRDIKDAALFVRGLNLPDSRRIFSTEIYNEGIGAVKVGYWAGAPKVFDLRAIKPSSGDIIVLSSVYPLYPPGGLENYRDTRDELIKRLPAHMLHKPYGRYAWPLLTDIMQEPGTAQNPLAWGLRYQRQYFETTVLEVDAAPGSDEPRPPMPLQGPAEDKTIEKLKNLERDLRKK